MFCTVNDQARVIILAVLCIRIVSFTVSASSRKLKKTNYELNFSKQPNSYFICSLFTCEYDLCEVNLERKIKENYIFFTLKERLRSNLLIRAII